MNRPLLVIFAAVGLDAVGIGLIFPILPRLLEEVTRAQHIAPYIGIMTALYAAMQFIFAPVLGALSDNLGRRPVLLISLAGAAINYVVMAFAPRLWILLLGRAIAGLTSANISVATAYITDISAKAIEHVASASSMPCLASASHRAGAWRIARRLLAAAAFHRCGPAERLQSPTGFFHPARVSHTRAPEDRSSCAQPTAAAALGALDEGTPAHRPRVFHLKWHGRGLRHLLGVVGFDTFRWNGFWIGLSLGTFGICQTLVQVVLPGPATKPLGERWAVVVGIACASIALVVMAFANQGWIVFAIMPIFALGGIGTPAFQALATRHVDPDRQGQLQGVLASAVSLASIIAPLAFSTFYFVVQKVWPGAIWLSVVVASTIAIPLVFLGTRPVRATLPTSA